MKHWTKPILLVGVLLGTLVLYYRSTNPIGLEDHVRFDHHIDHVQTLDTALNEDLLKVRFHLLEDYDGFSAKIASLQEAVAALEHVPEFVPAEKKQLIESDARELGQLVAQKEELLEVFKSKNAVLNNSMRHLPVVGAAMIREISTDEEAWDLAPALSDLVRQVLLYTVRPSEDQTPDIRRSLARIEEWRGEHPEHPLNAPLSLLAAHANSILKLKPTVDALTRDFLAVPTARDSAEILRVYDREFNEVMRESNVNRAILNLLCGILLLGVGWAFHHIDAARRDLDRRVNERTLDLQNEIVERRRMEAALLDSKLFLQSSLDALSAEICILDEEGRILAVNRAWREFAVMNGEAGCERSIGMNYLEICGLGTDSGAGDAADVARGIRGVIAGEIREFELEYPCHDLWERRWYVVRGTRFVGEGPARVVIAHEDVTARELAQQAVRAKDALIRIGGQLTRTGGWAVALPERRVFWSDGVVDILEYPRGYEPTVAEALALYPNGWRREVEAAFEACVKDGTPFDLEAESDTAQGRRIWLRLCGEAERHADGSIKQVRGAIQDITEQKRAEAETESLHRQLVDLSRRAGMAEVATGVLHNVGNVLNSVNISSSLVADTVRTSKLANLQRVVALLEKNAADLSAFVAHDPQGQNLIAYLRQLDARLKQEQKVVLSEAESLRGNIEHIKDVVAMQQSYAMCAGVTEIVSLNDLIEDALRLSSGSLHRHEIEVVRELENTPRVSLDKHRLLQILVNLVRNAKQACVESGVAEKKLTFRVTNGAERLQVAVSDNGVGISPENLTRIFSHGFTTRKDGHGFGLHSSALAATEMGGRLRVHSDGQGRGATFTLELPVSAVANGHQEAWR